MAQDKHTEALAFSVGEYWERELGFASYSMRRPLVLAQVVSGPSSVSQVHLGDLTACHYSLSLSRGPGTMGGNHAGDAEE